MGLVQVLVAHSVADVQRLSYTLCLDGWTIAFSTTMLIWASGTN